ncbi:hypothetical protein ACK35S_11110 [Aeromonas veronii]
MDAMKLSVSKEFIISTQPIGCITLYHNPNDPYGISDLIELALALIYLLSLGLCILHALWILLRHWEQGALEASALLALCAVQWHSYDYLHHLAASLSIP